MSDTGAFIVVYALNTRIMVAAGAIDTLLERVAVIPPAGSLPLGAQNTDGVPSVAISNQVNGAPYVWVEMHRSHGSYFWNAGTLGLSSNAQQVNSWTTEGTHFDDGTSNPSVAINDSGVVLSVHSNGDKLYYNIGTVDTLNFKVNIGGGKYYGPGTLPQVALSNKGQVVAIHIGANGGAYYYTGTVQTNSKGAPFIAWDQDQDRPIQVPIEPWTDQQPACLSVLDDGTVYVSSGQNCYRQGELVDQFAGWTPPFPWLKYSGAWGKPGSGTIIDIFGVKIAQVTPGPPGPAYRASYVNGPSA